MSRSRWDDDDDNHPVYKGPRNYDSVGAKVGEAFSDLAVSVRRAAGHVLDDPTVSKKAAEAGKTWSKAKRVVFGADDDDDDDRPAGSGLPENCFCDMRGFACPRHRGREKWRFGHDFQLHVKHNVDPSGSTSETALGAGSKLAGATFGDDVVKKAQAAAGLAARDADMAQLVQMGFHPKKAAEALAKHKNLDAATNALLDDPNSAASDEALTESLPEPPSAPPPKPPISASSVGASSPVPVIAGPPGSASASTSRSAAASAGVSDDGPNLISLDEIEPPGPSNSSAPAAPSYPLADLDPMTSGAPFGAGLSTMAGPLIPSQPVAGGATPCGAGGPSMHPLACCGSAMGMNSSGAVPVHGAPAIISACLPAHVGSVGGAVPPNAGVPSLWGQPHSAPSIASAAQLMSGSAMPPTNPLGYAQRSGVMNNEVRSCPGPQLAPHATVAPYSSAGASSLHSSEVAPYAPSYDACAPVWAGANARPTVAAAPSIVSLTSPSCGGRMQIPPGIFGSPAPGSCSPAAAITSPSARDAANSGACGVTVGLGALVAPISSTRSMEEGSDGLPDWLSNAEAKLSSFAATSCAPAASQYAETRHPPVPINNATAQQPSAQSSPAAPAMIEDAASLQWLTGVDPASGRTYYYCPATKTSLWELPPLSSGFQSVSSAAAPTQPPVVVPPRTLALPPGWQSGIDPKSGVVYYCNPSLNVTQWEHPGAAS